MPKILILCIFTLFVSNDLLAQTPSVTPNNPPDYKGPVNVATTGERPESRQISGGVLNGKATSLPKPPYPAAARAVGASGAVSVQVLIDENGDVISANAVSGHPLLRAAAVAAARGAKFSPTQLQGQPVKVSGIITYNFVGPLYPARLGFILSNAKRTADFNRYSTPESLAYQLPPDWTPEKEILKSLTIEERPVVPPKVEEKNQPQQAHPDYTKPTPKDNNRYTVKGDINFSAAHWPAFGNGKLDAKSLSSLQNLLDLIGTRMTSSESATWSYELGTLLGTFVAETEDQATFASNLAQIESLSERAPSTVIQASLQRVKEFIESCRTEGLREDNRQNIIARAEILSNQRY